jgi:hypothetical protein
MLGHNLDAPPQQSLYVSVQLSDRRFHEGEAGHYTGLARWLRGEAKHSNQVEAGFAINVGG